ncbi:MAG: glycosyltransferase [Bacilli bacterium]|nr:glycosyltransferase [Bacilli bacterium]
MAKVVFCVQQLFELGGTEQVTIDLANRLAEKGHDVEVVSFAETKSRPCVYSFSEKVKVTSLDIPFSVLRFENVAPALLRKGRIFSFIGFGVRLLHHCLWKAPIHRKRLYERIKDGGTLVGTSLESYRLAPKKGRVIHEFHYGIDEFQKPFFRMLLWGTRKPDLWIFLSEETLKKAQKKYPRLVGRSTFIHNPIRFPSELHLEPHDHRLLFLGRYMPQKNPMLALGIAKALKEDGFPFHLDMYGNGNLFQAMQDFVKNEGLGGFVSLFPATRDIRTPILSSDLLLITSDFEGWPLIIGEANAFSCPVITTEFGQTAREMIADGENGWVIPSKNPEDFAKKVEEVFADPNRLVDVKKKAYARSLCFGEDIILAKWNEVL